MGDGFKVEDGDGTFVTITENKRIKFVEPTGGGININFTDVTPGSDIDPFDLEFSIKDGGVTNDMLASNSVTNAKIQNSTIANAKLANSSITINGSAISLGGSVTTPNTMGAGFVLEDGDGTEVTITENKEIKFVETDAININWTDTDNGTDGDPYDLSFGIKDDGITNAMMADNAIDTGQIAASAVTEAKIANAAVTNNKLGTQSVSETKIADLNVTSDKISALAVTTAKIANCLLYTSPSPRD